MKGPGHHERVDPGPMADPPPHERLSDPTPDSLRMAARVPHTLDEVIWHLIALRRKYGGSMYTSVRHLVDHRNVEANILTPF